MGKRSLIVLLLVTIAAVVSGQQNEREVEKATMYVIDEVCQGAAITDGDILAFLQEDVNMSYQAKCVGACIFKKFGFLTSDGKFDIKVATNLYRTVEIDEEILALRLEVLDYCTSVDNDDVCEFSYELGQCMIKRGKELGIEHW